MTEGKGQRKRVALPMLAQHPSTTSDPALTGEGKAAWLLLGVLTTFVVLLPLSMWCGPTVIALYAAAVAAHQPPWLATALIAGMITLASTAASALVTRVGPPLRRRDVLALGLLSGVSMWAVSRHPLGCVLLAVTVPASWFGRQLAQKWRSSPP